MSLPVFYTKEIPAPHQPLVLDEETSRHVSQVLRMREGELLQLTDGLGNLYTAEVTDPHKKRTSVTITDSKNLMRPARHTIIAISLLKNNSRFEWFLEKATELGIREIVPLICERTERQHFRQDRMQSVLISAMLQSQQAWLPVLQEPVGADVYIKSAKNMIAQKFIAHCMNNGIKSNLHERINASADGIVLIGPEGDFSVNEIDLALENGFQPVSLGDTRLRAETAGIVAATLLTRHI
ncbi:MAG TPA: RsmE family RNA methyltransferase [Chitinophagaceae bacterium]